MKMNDDTDLIPELEHMISQSKSIFGLKVLDTLENVLRTRILPLRLNLSGRENLITLVCNENPYDIVFHDIKDFTKIQSLSPPRNLTLPDAVAFAKRSLLSIQAELLRDNQECLSIIRDLEKLKAKGEITRFEFSLENHEISVLVEVSIKILKFLRPRLATEGKNCKNDSFLLKLVFDQFDGSTVLRKFKVQLSREIEPHISEASKMWKNISYENISGFIVEMKKRVGGVLREVMNSWDDRVQLFRRIFAVYQPLGIVLGINSEMTNMNVSLGKGKLLKITVKKTFPATYPTLAVFKREDAEDKITMKNIKMVEVFQGEKNISNMADNIITYIHSENVME